MKQWKNFLLDLFFPQFCLNCNREGFVVCSDCLSIIDINPFQYCHFCSFPNRLIKKGKCPSHQDFKLNGLFSAVSYQNPLVKKMIFLFKYKPYIKTLASPLAFLIISHFALLEKQEIFRSSARASSKPQPNSSRQAPSSVFIPVPIFAKKERERGYNQAGVIGEILSLHYRLPQQTKNLIKIKNTQNQVGLSKEKRQENIFGAFLVKNPAQIAGKTIFLIDDVFTTGATLEECARVLKLAGAKKVFGIVVAREGLEK